MWQRLNNTYIDRAAEEGVDEEGRKTLCVRFDTLNAEIIWHGAHLCLRAQRTFGEGEDKDLLATTVSVLCRFV